MMPSTPYPPAWLDLATLSEWICSGESTIEKWVKEGKFPEPVMQGGKRLWRWKEVEKHLARGPDLQAQSDVERIREATRAISAQH